MWVARFPSENPCWSEGKPKGTCLDPQNTVTSIVKGTLRVQVTIFVVTLILRRRIQMVHLGSLTRRGDFGDGKCRSLETAEMASVFLLLPLHNRKKVYPQKDTVCQVGESVQFNSCARSASFFEESTAQFGGKFLCWLPLICLESP